MKLSKNTIAQIIIWVATAMFTIVFLGKCAAVIIPPIIMLILLFIERDKLIAQQEDLFNLLTDIINDKITEFIIKELKNKEETK